MKEFSAQTGGRYTYADDLENLQELALAFAQLFDDCDNFIVSGCEVESGSISSGYVFLNGKMRYFSGATGITSWPQYIYELNSTESVPYESGGSKVGRNIYSCALAKTVPTTADTLTNAVPKALEITATGGLRMKDAFIGKYALLLNPANTSQTVNSFVTFAKQVRTNADLIAKNGVTILNDALQTKLIYDGSTFSLTSTGGENAYKLSIIDGEGFTFYVNDVKVAQIGDTAIQFIKPITAGQGTFGGLILTGNGIYQGTANAEADVWINKYSYNGEFTQFRNTLIGNGKGKTLLSVIGTSGIINLFGQTQIAAGTMDGLVLKANMLKSNNSLQNAIAWNDSANEVMARIGFINTDNQIFSVAVPSFNIDIIGHSAVNIGPAIKENGTLLSEKYVLQTSFETALDLKANADKVYSIDKANLKFATKSGGLSQFITDDNTAAKCRSQIGAMGATDLEPYVKLNNYLSDMAKTEEDKAKIRTNIGASAAGDFQPKLSDSGWVNITDSLHVRQIGNIVSVQGKIRTVKSGTVFNIPNTIAAPTHDVAVTIAPYDKRNWGCAIKAGTRACFVTVCDGTNGKITEFSLTYMV